MIRQQFFAPLARLRRRFANSPWSRKRPPEYHQNRVSGRATPQGLGASAGRDVARLAHPVPGTDSYFVALARTVRVPKRRPISRHLFPLPRALLGARPAPLCRLGARNVVSSSLGQSSASGLASCGDEPPCQTQGMRGSRKGRLPAPLSACGFALRATPSQNAVAGIRTFET